MKIDDALPQSLYVQPGTDMNPTSFLARPAPFAGPSARYVSGRYHDAKIAEFWTERAKLRDALENLIVTHGMGADMRVALDNAKRVLVEGNAEQSR